MLRWQDLKNFVEQISI